MTVMDVIARTIDYGDVYKLYEDFTNDLIASISKDYISNLASYSKQRVASYSVFTMCNIANEDNNGDEFNVVEIRIL